MAEISNAVYEYLVGESEGIVEVEAAPDADRETLFRRRVLSYMCSLLHHWTGTMNWPQKRRNCIPWGVKMTPLYGNAGERQKAHAFIFPWKRWKNIFWAPDDSRCDMTHPMRLVYAGEVADWPVLQAVLRNKALCRLNYFIKKSGV